MLHNLFSLYYYRYPEALVSLIHSAKNSPADYLKSIHETKDFKQPLKKPAPKTRQTKTTLIVISLGITLQIIAGIVVAIMGLSNKIAGGLYFGLAIILLYPIVWAYVPFLMLLMREWRQQGLSLNEN